MNVYWHNVRFAWKTILGVLSLKVARWTNYRITPRPLILVWESTNQCNSQCQYCASWNTPHTNSNLLKEDEIKTLLYSAVRMGLCGFVITGGGEPLLREDVFEIIKFAKQLGLWVALTTNGTLITQRNVREVLQTDLITVSVDSIDRNKNNLRRGNEGYEKVMNSIELLRTYNEKTYLTVQAVIDEKNWREINDFNEFFYLKGYDTIFQLIYNKHFYIDAGEWKKRVHDLKYHRAFTASLHNNFLLRFPEIAMGKTKVPCLAGSTNFVISPTGALMICNTFREPGNDLRRISFKTAWKKINVLRRYVESPERRCICGNTCFIPISIFLTGL